LNTTALKSLLAAKHPNTKLVIFPAHNESAEEPYSLFIDGGCGIADWRGLVNRLIAEGIDKYRLCIDDQFLHSTPLAGFAGACMIYGYLYKAMPPLGEGEKARYADLMQGYYTAGQTQLYADLEQIRRAAYAFMYP
jgi:hypothetical protein